MVGFADLLYLSAALAPDENPYLAVSEVLKGYLVPRVPKSAVVQLYFLIVIHALISLLVTASLWLRWRKSLFWVFRRHSSSPLILPHFSVSLALVAAAVLPIFQVLFVQSIQSFQDPLPPNTYGYIVLFAGSSPWWICQIVAWGLAASYLVELASDGVHIKVWARICNVVGFASPLVVLVITLVYSILGGNAYRDAVDTYAILKVSLVDLGANWHSTDVVTTLPSPPTSIFDTFENELLRVSSTWRGAFAFQAISGAILWLVLVGVAVPYLVSLRRKISTMQEASYELESNTRAQLRSTWISLVIILVTFTFVCIVSVVLNFVVFALPFSLQNPRLAQAVLFVPFFATGILGLPAAWLLFSKARQAKTERRGDKEWSIWSTVVGSGGKGRDERVSVAGQTVPTLERLDLDASRVASGYGRGIEHDNTKDDSKE